jgi:heavy metal efflux system protein
MLSRIVAVSIRNRILMAALMVLLLCSGAWAAYTLPIDAQPDVSTIQVAVLTDVPGLSPVEVERLVTFPIETALNGVPKLQKMRSVSRSGLSAVTLVFRDGTDVWFARQLVVERLRQVESDLPKSAAKPQLAPVSSGLGEIYQFVVRSDQHSAMQLRTILDWEIVPRLRGIPGIIEVNTMGGDLKQYQVVVDTARAHSHDLTLRKIAESIEQANLNIGGGYIDRVSESYTILGTGVLKNEADIGNVVLRTHPDGTSLLVKQLAQVKVGSTLRYGVITRDGEGEAVTGVVMMLLGANSRSVVHAVKDRVAEIQKDLPPGMVIEPIYDRADFVGRTLTTVMTNLAEGALVVLIVLALFLGTIRGAIAVVIGIPASMAIALFGMHAFDVTGDLMSLGAIDFGFLVDGPIVILEAVMAAVAGTQLPPLQRKRQYADAAGAVARPVVFSVVIIMLVYLPLLTLEGVEGKMFRPMAVTMACALAGAVVYSVVFFPAILSLLVPPPKGHGPRWVAWLIGRYAEWLPRAVRARWPLIGASATALVVAIALVVRAGADFLPRIDEGDIVVTIRRAPSISLDQARDLDLRVERVLKRYPEVITTLGMTGRAEVAIDPVGNESGDMFARLKPKSQWTTSHDLDSFSEVLKTAIESEVPGTFVSISQPIEDKTNELISGSRADVQIAIFGDDLAVLKSLSEQVGGVVREVPGSGDVRIERVLGLPSLSVKPDRARLARYGVRVEDAFAALEAARVGLHVGYIYEGHRRFELHLLVPPRSPTPDAIGDLFVEAAGGIQVPLSEVAEIEESEGPAQVRREGLHRTVRVDVNLRGRDLVSWVADARTRIQTQVHMPPGYQVEWGGQFENFERAKKRLAMVVPMAMGIIFAMLMWTFGRARYAASVFLIVPFALTGGMLGLVGRGLTFSIPAAVGFIALAGVSVLNGVVMGSDIRNRFEAGVAAEDAIVQGATHTARAVLTTAAVAAFGFLPMALSTGAGSEVQRPLATVVVVGIAVSTLLTLFVFPGVLKIVMGTMQPGPPADKSSSPP